MLGFPYKSERSLTLIYKVPSDYYFFVVIISYVACAAVGLFKVFVDGGSA